MAWICHYGQNVNVCGKKFIKIVCAAVVGQTNRRLFEEKINYDNYKFSRVNNIKNAMEDAYSSSLKYFVSYWLK